MSTEQLAAWNAKEAQELKRVSSLDIRAGNPNQSNVDRRSQAQKDHEQQRLFEADHEVSFFECSGNFNGFDCGSDSDSGL